MEKVLAEVKNFAKKPVTTLVEKAEKEEYKVIGIKLAVVSVVMALINVLTSLKSINAIYDAMKTISYYSETEIAEKRAKAIADADLFGSFIKEVFLFAIVIAVLAAALLVIAKVLKSKKDYKSVLALTTNAQMITAVGMILNFLLGYIYVPLGLIVLCLATLFAGYAQIYAFRKILGVEDDDKLTIVTSIVYTVVIIVAVIVVMQVVQSMVLSAATKSSSSLDSLSGLTSLFGK